MMYKDDEDHFALGYEGLETNDVESMLIDLLKEKFEDEINTNLVSVETFEEFKLLTSDKGVVVCFPDGREFDITVTRAR